MPIVITAVTAPDQRNCPTDEESAALLSDVEFRRLACRLTEVPTEALRVAYSCGQRLSSESAGKRDQLPPARQR